MKVNFVFRYVKSGQNYHKCFFLIFFFYLNQVCRLQTNILGAILFMDAMKFLSFFFKHFISSFSQLTKSHISNCQVKISLRGLDSIGPLVRKRCCCVGPNWIQVDSFPTAQSAKLNPHKNVKYRLRK